MPEQDWVDRAEIATLGSMILEPERIPTVASIAAPKDFRSERHRIVAEALVEMAAENEPIDLVTITQRLERDGKAEQVGAPAFLAQLMGQTGGTAANAERHAREVKRASGGRRHATLAARWQAKTKQVDYDPDAAAGDLVKILTTQSPSKALRPLGSIMLETLMDAQEPHPPMRTGVKALDALFSALDRRKVAVILARPGVGKTALGMQLVIAEANQRHYCVVFSAEMDGIELGYRLIAHSTGIEPQWIWAAAQRKDQTLEDDRKWQMFAQAMDHYSNFGNLVQIDDTSGISIDLLIMRAHLADQIARRDQKAYNERQREIAKENGTPAPAPIPETGLDMVFVDYLQLLGASDDAKDNDTKEQQVTAASRALMGLAKTLNCRVILIASLSNAGTTRYSGGVDYDVQLRMTLEPADDGDDEHLIARVSKYRSGPKGDIHLRYVGARYLYEDYYGPPEPQPPPPGKPHRRAEEPD